MAVSLSPKKSRATAVTKGSNTNEGMLGSSSGNGAALTTLKTLTMLLVVLVSSSLVLLLSSLSGEQLR